MSFYAAFAAHLAAQDDMVWSSIPAIPVNRCKVACAAPSRISPTGSHAITTPSWRWPPMPIPAHRNAWPIWHLMAPTLCALFGYFPGAHRRHWRYPERRDAAVAALVPHADYLLTGEPGAREAYVSATFG